MSTNARQQLCLPACIDPKKIARSRTAPFFGLMSLDTSISSGNGCALRFLGDFITGVQGITVPCSRGGPPLLDE